MIPSYCLLHRWDYLHRYLNSYILSGDDNSDDGFIEDGLITYEENEEDEVDEFYDDIVQQINEEGNSEIEKKSALDDDYDDSDNVYDKYNLNVVGSKRSNR